MPDCFLLAQNPDKHKMFDNTISWTPAIEPNSANLLDGTEYWSYTFFMVGESEACISYNCSESTVFMNMKTHMNMPSLTVPDVLVDLLPGTLFSYTVPVSSQKTEIVASTLQTNFYSSVNGNGFVKQVARKDIHVDGVKIEVQPNIENSMVSTDSDVRMNIFITSAPLLDPDSSWVLCGARKHETYEFSPLALSAVADQRTMANFLTDTDLQDKLALQSTTQHLDSSMFLTSSNAWKNTGGLLPPLLVCTHATGHTCKIGQLEFKPETLPTSTEDRYVRCNLNVALDNQVLPCVYTLGDVVTKYDISQLEIDEIRQEQYEDSISASNIHVVDNVRVHDVDTLTKKIAFGSVTQPQYTGMVYLCHTQYNNLPEILWNEDTLRPNIACGISRDKNIADMTNCVCGIITSVYEQNPVPSYTNTAHDSEITQYTKKIVRIIPEVFENPEYDTEARSVAPRVFITELDEHAVRFGDVLKAGYKKISNSAVQFYFKSDPSCVHAELDSIPFAVGSTYRMCENEKDPDNSLSQNQKNPLIVSGIVIPLGTAIQNSLTDPHGCCNILKQPSISDLHHPECTDTCFTDGSYENIGNTIRWAPHIDPNDPSENYWLYVTYSIHESDACMNNNCDEALTGQVSISTVALPKENVQGFEKTVIRIDTPLSSPELPLYAKQALPAMKVRRDMKRGLLSTDKDYVDTNDSAHWPHREYVFQQVPRYSSKHPLLHRVPRYTTRSTISSQRAFSPSQSTKPSTNDVDGATNTNNRMILSVDSAGKKENEANAAEGGTTCAKEITSINNNNQIIRIVCGDEYAKCDMLTISKSVSIEDFCQPESLLVDKYEEILNSELRSASAGYVQKSTITSITNPGAIDLCSPRVSRRLLQTETIQLTVIVHLNGTLGYIVDQNILNSNGNAALMKRSDLSNMKFSLCDSQQECEEARRALYVSKQSEDSVNLPPLVIHPPKVSPTPSSPPSPPPSPPSSPPSPPAKNPPLYSNDQSGEDDNGTDIVLLGVGITGGILVILGFAYCMFVHSKNQ
jgi:hypothetical protein